MLTGLRTGKRSFYPEYVRSNERLERAVTALDRISGALVRTSEGPYALVEAVVRAAADHMQARWLLIALADGALRAARPRFMLLADGELITDEDRLPADAAGHLATLRSRPWEAETFAGGADWVRVPMILDDEPVGGIVARPGKGVEIAGTDLPVLRVLANQAAIALHNSFIAHATAKLRGRAEELSEAAQRRARDLAERDAELVRVQQRLLGALQRQEIDDERHRIARELHDSVIQYVLSAGMTIEVCRAELAALDGEAAVIAERLGPARDLTRHAVERLRAAIYSLHHTSDEPPGPLPLMLARLSTVHLPVDFAVTVRVDGSQLPLPPRAEQSLLRLTGEALFNAGSHGKATRALVRLRYRPDAVTLSISDDGSGDPAQLRRTLRLTEAGDLTGRHQGLANMAARMTQLGGTLAIGRSRLGGIRLSVALPLPAPAGQWETGLEEADDG